MLKGGPQNSLRGGFRRQCGPGTLGTSDHTIVFRGAFCVDHNIFFSGDRHRPATLVWFLGGYNGASDKIRFTGKQPNMFGFR